MGVPILLLSARTDDADRIVGLEIGADDFVLKPYNPRELLARARAIVRRSRAVPAFLRVATATHIHFGTWLLKSAERELVSDEGDRVALTKRELKLLQIFLAWPNVVLSREQLLELVQGTEAGPVDRKIDNQVSRLRRKIEPDAKNPIYIRTIWGGGYAFISEWEQV